MNPASEDTCNLIDGVTSLGLIKLDGTGSGNLCFGREPVSPDNIVTVQDNPGGAPMLTLRQSESSYFYSSVNIRVRNTDYRNGYSVIKSIVDYLHGLSGVTEGGTTYLLFKAMEDPQLLSYDDNDRPIWICNFEIHRK
jgi:hypothetical protein